MGKVLASPPAYTAKPHALNSFVPNEAHILTPEYLILVQCNWFQTQAGDSGCCMLIHEISIMKLEREQIINKRNTNDK